MLEPKRDDLDRRSMCEKIVEYYWEQCPPATNSKIIFVMADTSTPAGHRVNSEAPGLDRDSPTECVKPLVS